MSADPLGGESISRNAGFALAAQAATAAFTAGVTLFLVRFLDPSGYGIFVLALGFSGLVLLPADFGVSQAAARFIAERRGDPSAIAAAVASAIRLKLAFTSTFALALFVLAAPIAAAYDAPGLTWPLRGMAIALLGQSMMLLFAKSFVAMGKIAWQLRLYLSESVVEATATIGAVLMLGGASAAAFGRAFGYAVGAVLGALFLYRLLGRGAIADRRGGPNRRELVRYAGALLIIDGAYALFSHLDVLFVGAMLGTTAVGIYGAPLKLTALLHYPGLALGQAIAPRLAKHPDRPRDTGALVRGLRYMVILQTAVAVTIAVWADPIVELLLGQDYAESAEVLRALAPFVFLHGVGPLVAVSVNYLGEARRRIPIAIGCLLLNVVLMLVLIEEIGILGAAISLDVSYAFYVCGHLWVCARLLDLSLRPLALTAVRSLLAGAPLAAVLLAFGTDGLGPLEWLLGLACGGAAFVAVLLATRETSTTELRKPLRAVGGRLRRSS